MAEALGERLFAVRFDTPSSRRGDFYHILQEARWELDLRGFQHVKFFVSGGIQEEEISKLNPLVDAYGIGTSISNAPVVDFSMDIVEVDGKPVAKRGKFSGQKNVLRCSECHEDLVLPVEKVVESCYCGGKYETLLNPLVENGNLLYDLPEPGEIRKYVLEQVKYILDL